MRRTRPACRCKNLRRRRSRAFGPVRNRSTQSAEQACTLGGGVALGHRLEGEAEAGADDGKAGDHQPLGTGLGQVGCLEHEGGHQRQQAQRTLRLAEAAIQRLGAQVNPKITLSVLAARFRGL